MFKMFKILDIDYVQEGVVRSVENEIVRTFHNLDKVDEDELIKWFDKNNMETDSYLICQYDSDGLYMGTIGVMFYHSPNDNEDDCESFFDCAEWDFRVLGDAINKPISIKYLNSLKYSNRFTVGKFEGIKGFENLYNMNIIL